MSTAAVNNKDARAAKFARRNLTNTIATGLALIAMAFGLFWLFWILWETISLGFDGLTFATLTQMTPPPNEEGGLANAIYGSFLMVTLAACVGTPIGVMAGIYLAEFDTKSWFAATVRFVNDILLSAPSIVVGLFVYAVVVSRFKSFSGYAGIMALSLLLTQPELMHAAMVMHSRLLEEVLPFAAPPQALQGKQLWVSHGTLDQVLPLANAHAIRTAVQALPIDLR